MHTTCNNSEGKSGHNNKQLNGTNAEDNKNNIENQGETNNEGPKANQHREDDSERRGEVQSPGMEIREVRTAEEEDGVGDKMDDNPGTEREEKEQEGLEQMLTAPSTDREEEPEAATPQDEMQARRNLKVRDYSAMISTSEDDTSTPTLQTSTKRPRTQKLLRETEVTRDGYKRKDRRRKTPKL
jgi:hypothetical protein